MKAIVLAGGYSGRFYPYSAAAHKAMVKVMGKPILQYTLDGLKAAGIKEIILRVSEDGVVKDYFGNGEKFGLSIQYIVQKEALGMGEVLLKAEKYLDGDFILISASHVNSKDLVEELIKSKKDSRGAVLARKRENFWDYGVIEAKDGKLVRIIEKPRKGEEPSNLCLVGAFLLPTEIIEIVKNVEMSEFNFEQEVLALYVKENSISVRETQIETVTLKYPWDLLHIKNYLMKDLKGKIGSGAKISKSAEVDSNVVVEDGAEILAGAKIKGPAYIGKGVYIGTNSLIRGGSDLEENVSVGAFTEIKNSVFMQGSSIHSGFVGDSIVGSNCKIGSAFTTANKKIDRKNVQVVVKGAKVDTGLTSLGAIIGNNVKIGIKVSVMPGVIIGNNVTIGPGTSVFKNIEDDVTYYAKFQEIIEKK